MVSMDDGAVTFKGGSISGSRAVRVRPPRWRRMSHVANAHAVRCVFPTSVHTHVVGMPCGVHDTLQASLLALQLVAWYGARCGTPIDGEHGAVQVCSRGGCTLCVV